MEELDQNVVDKADLNKIREAITSYNTSFKNVVELTLAEGNEDGGYIADLMGIGSSINEDAGKIKGAKKYQLIYQISRVMGNTKDYLNTRDVSYIKAAEEANTQFLQDSQGMNSKVITSINGKLGNYLAMVKQIKENYIRSYDGIRELQKYLLRAEESVLKGVEALNTESVAQIGRMDSLANMIHIGMAAGMFIIFLIMLGAMMILNRTTKKMAEVSDRIKLSSHDTQKTSLTLKDTANRVSKAASEQASAIQETVATLNEITAMVNKSVDNALSSAEKANLSHQISSEGREAVNQMREAMHDIQESITQMMNRVEDSNQKIESIVKIIGEISNKTAIINDIVFQTKLLSFNASVEAARAGEHGKGFAVVAEEVGNLAQMSGNAAKEISELLKGSREQVESIVRMSKEQVGQLVQEGSSKVTSGVDIANRCDEILGEVVEHVSHVKELMHEISTASKEQAEGVNNISIAMNELDSATHSNSDMAHETSNCSNLLSDQSESLSGAIFELECEVFGANHERKKASVEKKAKVKKKKTKEEKVAPSVEEDIAMASDDELPENVHQLTQDDFDDPAPVKKASGFAEIPSSDDPDFKE